MEANALNAVDDYKKSMAFDEEVTKANSCCYECGFNDYKAKVIELFLDLNLNKVIIEEAAEEGEIQEENAEEVPVEEVTHPAPKKALNEEVIALKESSQPALALQEQV